MNLNQILKNITDFQWDKANIAHIAKHDVIPEESEEVFFDPENVLDEDLKHSTIEPRFLIIGKTKDNRILYQIFTIRGEKIRVISSRDINRKEAILYEKKISNS